MFNLNLPENLKAFIQVLDPENKHKIKDIKTAMNFLYEITKRNQPKKDIDILMANLPKLAF